jgi:hypothetical protein
MLSAVLFLAALVSIGYCMELGAVQTKLCRNPPTRGVHVWSPKSGKDADSASARFMRNWRQLQSRAPGSRLTTRNKCWQCCRRITCGRSGIREDTCAPAVDAADDLCLAAGCRPSGGAVDSPPQAVASRMCASGSQDERGLASASVNAVALGVYVVTACPSPHRWSLFVSLNGVCRREWVRGRGLGALSPAVEAVGSRGGAVLGDCV